MTASNKHFTLREFQSLGWGTNSGQDVVIAKNDFDDIWGFVLAHREDEKSRRVMTPGYKKLTANNYVGILQTRRGATVEILPKIDLGGASENAGLEKEIFLRMLRTWRNGPFRNISEADVRALRYFPLLEGFIAMFTGELLALTHRGLARHYTPIEENLRVLKGKLIFSEQLRHNLVHRERFYARYEEFSVNRPVNRLLKSALLYLQRLSRDTANQNRLRQARFYFDEVPESANIAADFQRARIDRTMTLYEKLFPWVRLFLQGSAPSTWRGGNLSMALLFPMERIFEDYVADRVRREWSDWDVRTQESKHWLVKGKSFALRPDIVARRMDGKELRILDTKWKHLKPDQNNRCKPSQADVYQMYAYGRRYQEKESTECISPVPLLCLLYPRTSEFTRPVDFDFGGGRRLRCVPVNLADENASIISFANPDRIPAFAEAVA